MSEATLIDRYQTYRARRFLNTNGRTPTRYPDGGPSAAAACSSQACC